MTRMDYHEWVRWVFDRPVRDEPWYWRGQEPPWAYAGVVISHFGRLCEECPPVLADYSDAQVVQGLNFILLSVFSTSSEMGADQAAGVFRGFRLLYENLFAVRCDEVEEAANPLNEFVYMLWDLPPPGGEGVERELVSMLGDVLFVRHGAVQESALHGLGHLQLDFPVEVATVVDRYLSSDRPVSDAMRAYAARARRGEVM